LSRGGSFIASTRALAFLIIFFYRSDLAFKAKLLPKIMAISAILLVTWVITSFQTFGFIDKRYSNQDAAGRIKEDVTTGRAELIATEMDAFFKQPLTGIGIGKMKEYRAEETGIATATHNEISRLLSEHGLPGLIALMIIALTPLVFWLRYRPSVYFFAFYFFWFLTINHSSMRLAAPAFVYGLCLIYLIHEKRPVHRKQALT
jgi:O-antigen ligase